MDGVKYHNKQENKMHEILKIVFLR